MLIAGALRQPRASAAARSPRPRAGVTGRCLRALNHESPRLSFDDSGLGLAMPVTRITGIAEQPGDSARDDSPSDATVRSGSLTPAGPRSPAAARGLRGSARLAAPGGPITGPLSGRGSGTCRAGLLTLRRIAAARRPAVTLGTVTRRRSRNGR